MEAGAGRPAEETGGGLRRRRPAGARAEATGGYPGPLMAGTGGGVAGAAAEQGGGLGGGTARDPRRSPRILDEAARRRSPVRDETPAAAGLPVCTPLLSVQSSNPQNVNTV